MAASDHTPAFGASIVPSPERPAAESSLLRPRLDSPALTPTASHEDMSAEYTPERPIPPHSPFYQHPPASFERVQSVPVTRTNTEKDLEAQHEITTPLSARNEDNPFTSKISVDVSKECKMWPSRQTLAQQRVAMKKEKRATRGFRVLAPVRDWWTGLTKRQRLYVKLVLALLVIGAIVGIAVGIDIAVKGGYYANNSTTKPVGSTR